MKATVLTGFKTPSGKTFLPGDTIEAEPEKLKILESRGRIRIEEVVPEVGQTINKSLTVDPTVPGASGTGLTGQPRTESDPIALAERIAIKFEAETPSDLGRPVIVEDGRVLACENDLPHVRMYAWVLINLRTGQPRPIDVAKAATDCHMTVPENTSRGVIRREGTYTGSMFNIGRAENATGT
jgi:hypothetical protein